MIMFWMHIQYMHINMPLWRGMWHQTPQACQPLGVRIITVIFCSLRSYVSSPASGAIGAGLTSPPSGSSGSGAGHKLARPPTPDSARPADRIKVRGSATVLTPLRPLGFLYKPRASSQLATCHELDCHWDYTNAVLCENPWNKLSC